MDDLINLAQQTEQLLGQQQLMLTTAESCTGGGLSYYLTSIPGSSAWFERGFVTYSNTAKMDMLGVNPVTLDTFGAVSEQTVREMAEGALRHSGADVSVAITGIAGPTGGSPQKPVGMVWIGLARNGFITTAQVDIYPGDRDMVRLEATKAALTALNAYLLLQK